MADGRSLRDGLVGWLLRPPHMHERRGVQACMNWLYAILIDLFIILPGAALIFWPDLQYREQISLRYPEEIIYVMSLYGCYMLARHAIYAVLTGRPGLSLHRVIARDGSTGRWREIGPLLRSAPAPSADAAGGGGRKSDR